MRFIANGPQIPNELLIARDEGNVLFFCGSGVSRAYANLPDFPMLAQAVLDDLGSTSDSRGRRLYKTSRDFERAAKQSGLVATDRIFGLLEQEFFESDVRASVAKAIKPSEGCALDAHQILLDLSRTRAGTRLVTTNFDLLFEKCDPALPSFNPPNLPDPRRPDDFRGIVHMHGKVDENYSRACDNEFVLSSTDFGRAYLADGWATIYIQRLLKRFQIVFVGYSADDPPVQYLLEALNGSETSGRMYAFQPGDEEQAEERWAHKGVKAIAYDDANGHFALWQSLRAWADRANDEQAWCDNIIANAAVGPAKLTPFERGQIAHLASTVEGSKQLVSSNNILPSEWLFSFDPSQRYAHPGKADVYDENTEIFDPFNAYGLDTDEIPEPANPDQGYNRREIPSKAWDAFSCIEGEQPSPNSEAVARFRSSGRTSLPPRLWNLGMYLLRVSHQPEALWWAAHQPALHPFLKAQIARSLRFEKDRYPAFVRDGWLLLMRSWRASREDTDSARHEIEEDVKLDGWSPELVREYVALYRPQLQVKASYMIKAPKVRAAATMKDLLSIDIEYPRPYDTLEVPGALMSFAVQQFRQELDYAISLERETNGRDQIYFDATRADDGLQPNEDAFRFTGFLNTYVNLISRLHEFEPEAAMHEVRSWRAETGEVFLRLQIWSAGQPKLTAPMDAGEIFLDLSDKDFWTSLHQRDLLFALRDRWSEMPDELKTKIELRLLTGHYPWPDSRENEAVIHAFYQLDRLHWLQQQGVKFSFNFEAEMQKRLAIAPDWTARSGESAADMNVGEAYSIGLDTDGEKLVDLPLSEILTMSSELTGEDYYARTQRVPFRGLSETRPIRALGALVDAYRKGAFDARAWTTFLNADSVQIAKPRMLRAIAHRLSRLSPEEISELSHPVSEWLRDRATKLHEENAIFDLVWTALIAALKLRPTAKSFRRSEENWIGDALNRPVGRMVDALWKDPKSQTFTLETGLSAEWRHRIDQLMTLGGDDKKHAIAVLASHINWLYHVAQNSIGDTLVHLALGETDESKAFWDGFFHGGRTPQACLFRVLKPKMIEMARAGLVRHQNNKLSGMLLAGWNPGTSTEPYDPALTTQELRDAIVYGNDEFRVQMIWHLERWALDPKSASWNQLLIPFLRDVWPKQRAARTPQVATRLAELAFSFVDLFPEIVATILPLLTVSSNRSFRGLSLLDDENGAVRRFPDETLALLWAILPEDASTWPYLTDRFLDVLEQIEQVANDTRLIELRRRHRSYRY